MRRALSLLFALVLAFSLGACKQGGEHPEDQKDHDGTETTSSGAGTPGTGDEPDGDDPAGDDVEHGGGGGHDSADFPAAEATHIAKISMRDFAFVDMPATITGPKLRIEATNNGPAAHEIIVFDADGNEVGGFGPIPSGESKDLSLELTAGTYEMRCEVAISETKTHLDEGMKAVFAVM